MFEKLDLNKTKTPFISAIFILLITTVLVLSNAFNDYRLKTNLTAFQKREMKSSVENFILTIDTIRKELKENSGREEINLSDENIKEKTLAFARKIVHESTFSNGAYLWINEVRNFQGGDNYGIRQVHGNLPETEGLLLSTSMQDAKGNLPYLTELEGIRENGEIFYRYHFKEYQSDKISEKITYAKLYEPYNWIVCTGTYLNSMYEPAGGVSQAKKIAFYTSCLLLFLISLLLFAYIIFSSHYRSKKLLIETELLKGKVAHDAMTGAGSRFFGTNLLQKYLKNFQTNGQNYSIAILDIDNFKSINDKYGHNSGDTVIKNLVNTIKESQSANDHIIRWGGDEFILTYKHHLDDLESVLDSLNKKIAGQTVKLDDHREIKYTISIGASHFSEKDTSISDTVKRIDDALYLAKRVKNSHYILKN